MILIVHMGKQGQRSVIIYLLRPHSPGRGELISKLRPELFPEGPLPNPKGPFPTSMGTGRKGKRRRG